MDDPEILFYGLLHGTSSARRAFAAALGETGDPRAPGLLCRALGERQARAAAAEALVRIGSPAVPAVCQALSSEEAAARECAARILGQIGHASAVPALCAALQDREASVRAQVTEALARIGDRSALPAIIEKLQSARWDVRRAAAKALCRSGDRRALLPLWEALLDAPAALDPVFRQALEEVARRDPGPELREVLRRLERELQALDGECRGALWEMRRHLLRAAAPLRSMPIPAAAPAPSMESLPLPAAPADPAAENLPIPATSALSAPKPPAARSNGAPAATPAAPTGSQSAAAGSADQMLGRFQSVAYLAPRGWTALRPVRVGHDVVFRRPKSLAYGGAAVSIAGYLCAVCVVAPFSRCLPPSWFWAIFPAALLSLGLVARMLPSRVRRANFKVDATAREIIIYHPLPPRGVLKRKRLPLDQIIYFLGHSRRNLSGGMGDRLYAVLADGNLEALTDNLGAAGPVAANLRILAATCGKPAYFLDRRTQAEDLFAVPPEGGFIVRDRAKLWESAKLLYTPDEETPA